MKRPGTGFDAMTDGLTGKLEKISAPLLKQHDEAEARLDKDTDRLGWLMGAIGIVLLLTLPGITVTPSRGSWKYWAASRIWLPAWPATSPPAISRTRSSAVATMGKALSP
jgi:hypothetical protein